MTAARSDGYVPLVSVIIVNYNGLRFIRPLFQSLLAQTYPRMEILLFDNGSTDGSAGYVKSHFQQVRVIELAENRGFSRPNNEGIKDSSGEYVLTLNVDVILERDFLKQLVNVLVSDSTIGWVSGKILKLTPTGKSKEIDCLGHHFHRDRYAKETDHSQPFRWADYSKPRQVFGASACAALYRRTMLEDVSFDGEYFDEDFVSYWEDVDLDWRANQRGWRCLYTPKAVAYHMRGGTGLYRTPEFAARYLANRFLIILKNDDLEYLLQDMGPFAKRVLIDFYLSLKRCPIALPISLKFFLQKIPITLVKRDRIRRSRRVPKAYIRSLTR
jgi:GT2 family glycosyltransferase